VEAGELIPASLGQQLLDGLGLLASDFQTQDFILDPLAPEVVQFGLVLGPGGLLAVDQQFLIDAEVEAVDALVQQRQGILETALETFEMALVDGEARLEVAVLEEIVELVAPLAELVDIRRRQIAA